ncbi:type II toxin-antitoxin system VapC family toxin [Pleurocapsales cyanobacterium LEGE 06147]|nr:type II toxin-antitoxin system VapC family toxin [Pleurocapsales cyanobacterium LEGE 06147]
MVIDTSAILAILNLESEAEVFTNAIANDPLRLLSAGTALEISIIVKARKEEVGIRELDFFIYKAAINTLNFDENQLKMARYAFFKYGKGRHPASLNFGDCFAYALCKTSGQPLLFKGNDFSQTDIIAVV